MRVDLFVIIFHVQALLVPHQQYGNRAHFQAGKIGNEWWTFNEPARWAKVGRKLDGILEKYGCELSTKRLANTGHGCVHARASICFSNVASGRNQTCLRYNNNSEVVEVKFGAVISLLKFNIKNFFLDSWWHHKTVTCTFIQFHWTVVNASLLKNMVS